MGDPTLHPGRVGCLTGRRALRALSLVVCVQLVDQQSEIEMLVEEVVYSRDQVAKVRCSANRGRREARRAASG